MQSKGLMMKTQILIVRPIGKPRMTQRDKWKPSLATSRYRAYKDELNWLFKDTIPDQLDVTFNIEMPKSWSEKKKTKMDGTPHQQKPDIDNLVKGLLDALCEEDAYVFRVNAVKYWSRTGSIKLREII